MDKLLVIGSTGLLGSKVLELAGPKYEAYGTYSVNKRDGLFHLDVRNKQEVNELLERIKPDFVFDTHALNNVDYCETHKDEAYVVNVEGSMNVAIAAEKIGAKCAFVSSDYVFDGTKSLYKETDKQNPLNYYGKTKWVVESVLDMLGMNTIVARTSSIYGVGSSTGKKSFIPWLVESLEKKNKVEVISDLYYSPTYNVHLAQAVFGLLEGDHKGIFNVVGKDCISKYEFALGISREFGLDLGLLMPIDSSKLGQEAVRAKKVRLSTRKLKEKLSVVPSGIRRGLKELHKEMSK